MTIYFNLVMLDISRYYIILLFPDITHNKVKNGGMSAILILIKLNFFRAYLTLRPHICFIYSNDLAIGHGFTHVMHINVNNNGKSPILNLS